MGDVSNRRQDLRERPALQDLDVHFERDILPSGGELVFFGA